MTKRAILGNSVTVGHRPAWPGVGSWLTLLIALMFTGICGAVWVNNEAMAVSLLSEGVVEESTAHTLPGTIRSWAMGSGIFGLVTAQLVLLRGVFGIAPWAPVQALAAQAWKAGRPGVDSLRAFLVATIRVSASLLQAVGSGFTAIARATGLALGYTQRAVFAPVAYAGRGLVLGLDYLHVGVSRVLRHLWAWVSTVVRILGLALRFVGAGMYRALGYLVSTLTMALGYTWLGSPLAVYAWRGLVFGLEYLQRRVAGFTHYLGRGSAAALGYTQRAVFAPGLCRAWLVRPGVSPEAGGWLHRVRRPRLGGALLHPAGRVRSGRLAGRGLVLGLSYLQMVIFRALRRLGWGSAHAHGSLAWPGWMGIPQGPGIPGNELGNGPVLLLGSSLRRCSHGWPGASPGRGGVWTMAQVASSVLRYLFRPATIAVRHLWSGLTTALLLVGWLLHRLAWRAVLTSRGAFRSAAFAGRTVWTGFSTVPDVGKTAVWVARHRKGVSTMSDFSLTSERVLSLIATLWLLTIVGSMLAWTLWPAPPEPTIKVVHWATGHLMREGELPSGESLRLLPVMGEEFNKAGHRTESGTRIVVEVHNVPSELQADYLVTRVTSGRRIDLHRLTDGYVDQSTSDSDPAIVTPSSAHWLVTANYEAGRALVDLEATRSMVGPVIGIVTYEEMARCLGWPEKEIGYADIIALWNDPEGWGSYDCQGAARWGKRPLVAFTDPTTSSTGRSLLLALYSIAAGKPPEELTLEDIESDDVVSYVKQFQRLIDHYLIGTTVLNTKIHQGPRYGHFFIMPEDNLIHLYEGTESAFIGGVKKRAPPITERMVMIYPKEGSMPRKNCACIVQADWVAEEQVEAAERWIDYLLEDEQQRSFMAAGFRPATDLPLTDPISDRYGLDPTKPAKVLNPSLIKPEVAAAIDQSWEFVKRPGIVTFVVDTSGSMLGDKLRQAKDGLVRALDNMARNNQVGLVTFDDEVSTRIPVAQDRFAIADAIYDVRAGGGRRHFTTPSRPVSR